MNWLITSIFLFYGILILVNVPAAWLGLEFESNTQPKLWFQPPGFVIPLVWFLLFTLMGIARFYLTKSNQPSLQWSLFMLAILCASYAYYTLGLAKWTGISALWFGLLGNMVVILFAAVVVVQLYEFSKTAAYLVVPVILWTSYATLIVIGEMRLEKLI